MYLLTWQLVFEGIQRNSWCRGRHTMIVPGCKIKKWEQLVVLVFRLDSNYSNDNIQIQKQLRISFKDNRKAQCHSVSMAFY